MKKLLVIIYCLIPLSTYCQEPKVDYGFYVGNIRNYHNIKISESSIYNVIRSTNTWGFEIGLNIFFLKRENINMRVSPTISFEREEITFSNSVNSGDILTFEPSFIRLPCHLMIRPTNKYLYILSGLSSNILLQGQKEEAFKFLKLKNYDISLDFGLGFQIPIKILLLTPEIKYSIGLNNILNGNSTNFEKSIESFNRNRISLGISLRTNWKYNSNSKSAGNNG